MTTSDLISRARGGDGDAFGELTEPHRPELLVHCYRMLGSLQDAEDALQDTLLSAWQGLDGFEGRASIRTWLYRRSRLGLVKSHGSSHIPTRVSRVRPTRRWAPRHATSRPKPSRWPL